MSYNSRAPHKSKGLLKPHRCPVCDIESLHPFRARYTDTRYTYTLRAATKPTEPYPLLMAAGICDI